MRASVVLATSQGRASLGPQLKTTLCGLSMAFNEIETQRINNVVEAYVQKRRPPPHIRPQLDIGFRIDRQSVEIFEIRPAWKRPEETMEHAVA